MPKAEIDKEIEANEPLLNTVYKRYANTLSAVGIEREDAKQEMRIAMWYAIEKYDPKRGPFGPYASMRMTHVLLSLIKSARKRLHNKEGILPVEPDGSIILIDRYDIPDAHGVTLDTKAVVDNEAALSMKLDTEALLNCLPERQASIMRHRLMGDTMSDIAAEEGVSPQRIQQLSSKALNTIHKVQEAKQLGRSEEGSRKVRIPSYPDGVSGRSSEGTNVL